MTPGRRASSPASLVAAALLVGVAAPAAPAAACINETVRASDEAVALLAAAEEQLWRGDPAIALENVDAISWWVLLRGTLRARAHRVRVLASVLSGGSLPLGWSDEVAASDDERNERLRDALEELEAAADRDEPTVATARGIALLALGRSAAALAVLQPLGDEDLLPGAAGWGALARAQGAAHLDAREAWATCRQQAGPGTRTDELCGDPPERR